MVAVEKRVRKIFNWLACLLFCISTYSIGEHNSIEEKILRLLPENSRIAEIPLIRYRSKDKYGSVKITYKYKKGIIQKDIDGDGKEEIIVAYYTPPHRYWIKKNNKKISDEKFFKRAHVAIFEKVGDGLRKCWESDGFGNVFGIKFLPTTLEKKKIEYPWYIFGVKDIDNDGILELAFSREGYDAMGGKTEIWGWNGKKYIRKLTTSGELHFKNTKGGSEIISVSYYAGKIYITHYSYDKQRNKYQLTSHLIMRLSEYLKKTSGIVYWRFK